MSVLSPAKYLDEDNTIKDLSFNTIYPVGSIYMSVNNVDPSKLFGGTWEAWGSGRVPVGVDASDMDFSTVEKTGGKKTVKLSIDEMPSHNHQSTETKLINVGAEDAGGTIIRTLAGVAYNAGAKTEKYLLGTKKIADGVTAEYGVPSEGGGSSHNNLQPYITCYMWKRTN